MMNKFTSCDPVDRLPGKAPQSEHDPEPVVRHRLRRHGLPGDVEPRTC